MPASGEKLKPIGPYLIGQIVEYVGTPATNRRRYELSLRRWHVVQTEAMQETRVEEALEDLNFGTYLPREPKKVRAIGERYRTCMKPMLRGYVFAGFDTANDPWREISSMRGVIRLFKINEYPVHVGEWEMQCVREAEAIALVGKVRHLPSPLPKVGNFVQVKEGPFAMFFGFVVEVMEKRRSVKVEVNLMRQLIPVELEAHQVEVVLDKPKGTGVSVSPLYKRPRPPR